MNQHPHFDGIVLDLGVSSPQLDDAERGFSFSKEGPVDMRMDAQTGISARDFLIQQDEDSLANILYFYGEEPRNLDSLYLVLENKMKVDHND